jgi:hypothetical protein
MKEKKTPQYVLLSPDFSEVGNGSEAIDVFFSELKENFSNFKNSNLILDFSQVVNTDERKILLFSPMCGRQKDQNNSFVIVSEGINLDDVPEEMVVVPTLQEAKDIIEIENIERDLGF